MNASIRILTSLATLLGSVMALAIPVTGSAGPLGMLQHSTSITNRVAAIPHVTTLSVSALHPIVGMSQHPMALDVPRQPIVNLHEHEAGARSAAEDSRIAGGLHNPQGLKWEDGSAPVSPTLISLARNYHREGLPVLKLWQADRNMVSVGLNPHGVPGIFFTQKMGK